MLGPLQVAERESPMPYEYLALERPEDRIAVVRFSRGDKANALSLDLMAELTRAARELDGEADLSAVVLAHEGPNFTLGFDLKDPKTAALRDAPLAEKRIALRAGPDMCRAWAELEPMTIGAIEGWCVGGGVALAAALDLRVAAQDATFYAPEIERGMNMSWNSVPRLVNLIGPAKTKRVTVLAERIGAERALDWGLVDEVAATGDAFDRAMGFARRLAELPPVPVRMCKQGVNAAADALTLATSIMDRDQFALAFGSADAEEAINAFFENRTPKFTGE